MHSSSFTPVKWPRLGLSRELPRPGAETSEDTELETRLWPAAEKSETDGEAGAEVLMVNGESGWRAIVGSLASDD